MLEAMDELYLRIEKDGFPVAIIEGLIHNTKDYLHTHIKKATINYNQSGCPRVYIVCYSGGVRFDHFMESYQEWVREVDDVEILGYSRPDVPTGVRCLEGRYNHNGISGKLYLIGVNTPKKN